MKISPVGESYRLLQCPSHQGLIIASQADASGLRLQMEGVRLEISAQALKAARLAKTAKDNLKVESISNLANTNRISS